jgi:ATP synthase protein I
MNSNDRRWVRLAGLANSVGMVLVVATGIGGGLGWYLDKRLGTQPILMLIFGLIGVAAGFAEIFKIVKEINEEEEKHKDRR